MRHDVRVAFIFVSIHGLQEIRILSELFKDARGRIEAQQKGAAAGVAAAAAVSAATQTAAATTTTTSTTTSTTKHNTYTTTHGHSASPKQQRQAGSSECPKYRACNTIRNSIHNSSK